MNGTGRADEGLAIFKQEEEKVTFSFPEGHGP